MVLGLTWWCPKTNYNFSSQIHRRLRSQCSQSRTMNNPNRIRRLLSTSSGTRSFKLAFQGNNREQARRCCGGRDARSTTPSWRRFADRMVKLGRNQKIPSASSLHRKKLGVCELRMSWVLVLLEAQPLLSCYSISVVPKNKNRKQTHIRM